MSDRLQTGKLSWYTTTIKINSLNSVFYLSGVGKSSAGLSS